MYKVFFKRFLDVVLVSIAFIILFPFLFIIIFTLFIVQGKNGIFFFQERPGRYGKIFKIYKFKSMTDEKDEHGNLLPNNERITPLGAFIRKTSIDELPQFYNVLKGDMSLIGPRPLPVRYLQLYTSEQARRHEVRPGITGWAQVKGRNTITWTKKFELDIWYVDHLSFLLDLKIIFMTIKKILFREGVDAEAGNVGGSSFDGTN